nr:ribonuclease H-like domain-containing protein [Tanacetum cinerariifolium]
MNNLQLKFDNFQRNQQDFQKKFKQKQDDFQNQMIQFMQNLYNKPSTSNSSLPSNTIPNPKGEAKAITTRSGMSYKEPPIPPTSVNQQEPAKVTTDTEPQNSDDIHPPTVQAEVQIDKPTEEPVMKLKLPTLNDTKMVLELADRTISKHTGVAENVLSRYKLGEGYHVVPLPYTGTFMPHKPDLVFHDAPTVNETIPTAFIVELSLTKPNKDLSQPSVKPVEHPIPADNLRKVIPRSRGHINSRNKKACFVCKSLTHLIKDCDYYEKKMVQKPVRNHAIRGNHQHYPRMTLSNPQRHVVPTTVLTRSRLVPLPAARPVNIVIPQTKVQHQKPTTHGVNKVDSPIKRPINLRPSPQASNFPQKVTIAKDSRLMMFKVSRETRYGNISYLSDFEEINYGHVAFGGNPKGGKITCKGKIRTCKLDFDDVYFVKELKFNLFSVSQMYGKKNNVLFTDTECIVLSSNFKLPDDNHVLLRVPRKNNMYNVDLKNIVPSGDLTCIFAKVTLDESNLWHRRLGYINIKTMNKLVKGNLVRRLPSKVFENNHTCVACKKSKQHRASCKSKPVSSVSQPLQREFSVDITPQQNGIAERKNRTLIEAARTMLADSLLPIPFWDEAVNTACYVQNRVLVTNPHNKTPYELLIGRTPSIGFMRPFGCPVTILNTVDPLGKFDGKADEGFFVGYTVSSKAFRVFNGNQPNSSAGIQEYFDADKAGEGNVQQHFLFPLWSNGSKGPRSTKVDVTLKVKEPKSEVHVSPSSSAKTKKHDDKTTREAKGKSHVKLSIGVRNLSEEFEDFYDNSTNKVNAASTSVLAVGQNSTSSTNTFTVAGPSNIVVSPTLRKSLYVDPSQYPDDLNMLALEDITYLNDEEDVGFEVPDYPNKVYKVVKALYGLHQAPRSWYETLVNYLLENGFQRGKIDQNLFIKKKKGDILLVQVYVDDIIFGSTNEDLCKAFEKLMKDKFQMSLMDGKSASTSIDTKKPLHKDPDGEDVDVHTYRLVRNVDSSSKFYMVGKGFYGVDTPFFERMLVPQVNNDVADVVVDADVEPILPSPRPATTPPPPQQDLIPSTLQVASTSPPSPHQSHISPPSSPPQQQPSQPTTISMDLLNTMLETCTTLNRKGRLEESQAQVYQLDSKHAHKVLSMQDDEEELAELTKVIKVVTTAKLMTEVVTATATTITAAPSTTRRRKGKGILVEEPKPLKKQAQIEQDEAYARELVAELNANINVDDVIEQHFNSILRFLEKSGKELEEEASERRLRDAMENCSTKFISSEPKNFSDHFLLNTLKAMFEKPNVEASIWKSQRGSYGLAKVKSWKLLELQRIYAKGLLLLVKDLLLLVQVKAVGRKLRLLEESVATDEKMKKLL